MLLQISISELLDDSDGRVQPNARFATLLSCIGIAVDPVAIFDQYVDDVLIGGGDVLLFQSPDNPLNRIIFDLYRDPEDQLDLITIGIFCLSAIQEPVVRALTDFFLNCRKQIYLSLGSASSQLRDLADPSKYPRIRMESGYRQKIIFIQGMK